MTEITNEKILNQRGQNKVFVPIEGQRCLMNVPISMQSQIIPNVSKKLRSMVYVL